MLTVLGAVSSRIAIYAAAEGPSYADLSDGFPRREAQVAFPLSLVGSALRIAVVALR